MNAPKYTQEQVNNAVEYYFNINGGETIASIGKKFKVPAGTLGLRISAYFKEKQKMKSKQKCIMFLGRIITVGYYLDVEPEFMDSPGYVELEIESIIYNKREIIKLLSASSLKLIEQMILDIDEPGDEGEDPDDRYERRREDQLREELG